MPRRKASLSDTDDKLSTIAESDVELKLQRIEEELENLMKHQQMRSTGVVYGYFGWDFKFSSSKI